MGILRINGSININQFWPLSSSDADTTKLKLVINPNAFLFKKSNKDPFVPTSVYFGAVSKGTISTPVINTSKKDGTQTITIRLQGVDAPELHFRASPLKRSDDITADERKRYNLLNEDRRQYFAESATVALGKKLKNFANDSGIISAIFETEVEFPADAVDTYGRFIGNIIIEDNLDINLWLIKSGWAVPTFYSSMKVEEIEALLAAWKNGKKKKYRIGSYFSYDADEFDWELLYRKPPLEKKFNIGEDKGLIIMPKIFRRQTAWQVINKAGLLKGNVSFKNYLKNMPDELLLLQDFIENSVHSAKVYHLDEFISTDNKILKKPEEFIFKEKPGILVNSYGKKLLHW